MDRTRTATVWRLQAFSPISPEALSDAAVAAFQAAAEELGGQDLFSGGGIVVDAEALSELTGFNPLVGETITPAAVKRGAEAADAGRVKALANRNPHLRSHYVLLGVFLRVCAIHKLAIIPGVQAARPKHR